MYRIVHKLSRDEYLNPNDTEKYNLGLIYARKDCSNFWKLFYYTFIVIFGYNVLSDLPYSTKTFFGKGEVSVIFKEGFPESHYHIKPDYFNVWYLINLSHQITDFIWLIGIYELQTDFLMMLVHHTCTISLISFSYLSNYSHIGALILFLHDFGDIFVYVARLFLNTRAPEFTKTSSGILLLFVWIYTRIYILAELALVIYMELNVKFNWVLGVMWVILTFLYILHCYWVFLIAKKICNALFVRKYEDTFKVNKKS